MARKKTGRPISRRSGAPLDLRRRISFATIPLIMVFTLAECTVRWTWTAETLESSDTRTVMEPDPSRLFSPRVGEHRAFGASFVIDSDRFREVERTSAPNHVITLGDSSIFGHGLEDEWTLHAQLSDALARRNIDADVLCGAIPGYSTEQTIRVLDEWGWSQEPDLLVIGNLWSDGARSPISDREWFRRYESTSARVDQKLLEWSRLWTWFRSLTSPRSEGPVELIFERTPDGERRVSLEEYAENLDHILEEAAQRNIDAIVLSPCHEILLRDVAQYEAQQTLGYFGALNAVAEHRGVTVVEGCEVLRNADLGSRDDAFLPNDPLHPTGRSNRAYAEALAQVLAEAGWPERRSTPSADVDPFDQPLELGPDHL